jgi:hypothetical protein
VHKGKGKDSSLHLSLRMVCRNCHRAFEVFGLWGLAVVIRCEGRCEVCSEASLMDAETRAEVRELSCLSRGMETVDTN